MPTTEDYNRGHDAGMIAERLDGHDKHFAMINGSLERIGGEIHVLALAVQRLADQSKADAVVRVETAKALKDAAEVRWSPLTKAFAVLAAAATVIGIVLAFLR